MKKILITVLTISMILGMAATVPTKVYAAENTEVKVEGQQFEKEEGPSTRIIHTVTYSKTIKSYASSVSSFPDSRYYSEYYSPCDHWASGTLRLLSVVALPGGGYEATYSGTMYCVYTI